MFRKMGLLVMLLVGINTAFAQGSGSSKDNYGAIAFNTSSYAYGYAYDYKTQQEANQRALKECGKGCKVVLELQNECGAIYRNSERYGWSNGNSRQEAEAAAKKQCGANCKLVAWSCTTR